VVTFWPGITAARTGHEDSTAWIDQVAGFLAGRASQLPAPGDAASEAQRAGRARRHAESATTRAGGRKTAGTCERMAAQPAAAPAWQHSVRRTTQPDSEHRLLLTVSGAIRVALRKRQVIVVR
jgi:hypothetical protein